MINKLDLDYYKKYSKQTTEQIQYKKQKEIIKLSKQYSKQYNSQILYFDVLVNSDRADTIYKYKEDKPIICVVDYNKKWSKNNIDNPLGRELWIGHNILQQGDLIDFENKISKEKQNYLLTRKVENVNGHDIFMMKETTHILSWLNSKGDVCSSPIISENATKYSDGIFENSKIKVGDTKIAVTFPATEDTNEILVGKRFLFDKHHAYEVTDTQVTSPKGLRIIMMMQTEIHNEVDNLDLFIADYHGNAHEYSMEILNKNVILTTLDKYKLQANIYDKGIKVDNPQLEFDITNTDILSIEDDTITALKEGMSNVSIKFKDIIETIKIQIIKDDTDNYTCKIEGSDNIPMGRTKEYIGKFFEKGVEISDIGTWTITSEDGKVTDYATIMKTDDNKCTIKATSKWIFSDGKSKYFSLQLKGNTGKQYTKKIKVTAY